MTATDLFPRVEAGMAWLDAHVPGWVDRIDLRLLDISDCHRCVLGQLFGSFDAGLGEFVEGETVSALCGFSLLPDDIARDEYGWPASFDEANCFWAALREAWTTAILARRFALVEAERTADAMIGAMVER